MFKKILTHFSLLAFFTQIFHISYIGLLYSVSAPAVYAQNLTLDEMFNGYSNPNMGGNSAANVGGVTLDNGELFGKGFADAQEGGHFSANQAYQNESRLQQSANDLSSRIGENEVGQETDFDAAAYNTLKDNYNNNYLKLNHDDAIMTDSDQILSDLAADLEDPTSDFFSECTTVTNTYTETREYTGKVQYECQEPDRSNLDFCEIKRVIEYPVQKVGGTGAIEMVDDYTFDLIIGKEHNNGHSGGSCTLYPYYVDFKIREDVEIESVTLTAIWVDDMIRVSLEDEIIYKFYGGYSRMPEYHHEFGCEFSKSRFGRPYTRHDAAFDRARQANDGVIRFHLLLGVSGGGEGKAIVRVKTKNRVSPIEHIEQNPVGCAAQLGYVQPQDSCDVHGNPEDPDYINPQCDNPLTMGNGQYSSMCTFQDWECVSEAWHDASYDSFISNLPMTTGSVTSGNACSKVNATGYECNPLPGQEICGMLDWPESQEETCGTFAEMNSQIPDRCSAYRENGDCTLISSTPSFQDPVTGRTYITNSVYECNTYSSSDYQYTIEEETCSGEMQCVAGDCDFSTPESNGDFAEAMAVFKMLEDIKGNMECANPDDISTCKVFNGEVSYCGVEATGLGFDCCSLSAGQVNVFDYIKGIMHQYAMENSIQQIQMAAEGGYAYGSWAADFPTPINDTVSYVTDAVSSGWDAIVRNVTGETAEGVATEAASETIFSGLQQQIYQQIQNILPEALNEILFVEAGQTAGGQAILQMNPAITGALQTVMALYAAYQLVKLAAMMVSECDDLESAMGIKLDMGQCIYSNTSCHVDTPFGCWIKRRHYCCYPSPLGRIIMEQAAPILGISLDPRNGNCSGMTFEQVATLDWENDIDLTEWENLIMASGIPVTHNDLDIDTLSSQPWMPNNGHALNPEELNRERFNTTDAANTFNDNHDSAIPSNLDCSVYPRPPACESSLSILSP